MTLHQATGRPLGSEGFSASLVNAPHVSGSGRPHPSFARGGGVAGRKLENVIAPRSYAQVETPGKQFLAVPFIDNRVQEVLNSDAPPAKLIQRKLHIALALMACVVNGNQKRRLTYSLPGKANKAIP